MEREQIPEEGAAGGQLPGSLSTRNQEPLEVSAEVLQAIESGAAGFHGVVQRERPNYVRGFSSLYPAEEDYEAMFGVRGDHPEIEGVVPPGRGPRPRRGLLQSVGNRPSPKVPYQTRGTSGTDIHLLTNYFKVVMNKDWGFHQYAVDFNPPEDELFIRKVIIRANKELIGHRYLFDGGLLHTPFPIEAAVAEGGVISVPTSRRDGSVTTVTLRYLRHTQYGDPVYIQFYNLIVRKCMKGLGLEEIGRGFYDPSKPINYPALNVQLWPGFLTAINHHDEDVLLNVEVTHKVLRTESVITVLTKMEQAFRGPPSALVALITQSFVGSIVMTTYNRATYRVVSIKFDAGPSATFQKRSGESISFVDYYMQKYNYQIVHPKQPLIVGIPTKRQVKGRGKAGADEENKEVILIPELCLFTGLTDTMRANNSLMKELASNLHMGPGERIKAIKGFMAELMGTTGIATELAEWGLHYETDLEDCVGRVLPKEKIQFGNGVEIPNDQEDFTTAFRNKTLLIPEPLKKWIIFVTNRDSGHVETLVKTMQKVGGPLGVKIDNPDIIKIENPKVQCYIKAIDEHVARFRDKIQLAFIVLGSNNPLVYGAIKKRLAVELGVSSQCFLSKNLTSRGIMSIATKVVVQMSTKLGAQPWTVHIPTRGLMVIGYDSYNKIHAVVASLTPNFAKFFSTITNCEKKVSAHLSSDIEKCLIAYHRHNNGLPKHVVLYRVGNINHDCGQEEVEVAEIQASLKSFYEREESAKPCLTYIVVTKKTNTRLFKEEGHGNPPPGTILDNTVTLRGRYQFFLISATARQGTVAPCAYQVMFDDSPLNADKVQLLTYKLCHMYFNWSGTVSVPAPVQYAHKLAQITALACDGNAAHPGLSDLLFFL